MVASSGTLLAVLTNPPLTDGTRTLRRVDLAAELLGFDQQRVANLFAVPSHATGATTRLDLTVPWVAKNRPLNTTTTPPTAATATQKDD